MTDLIPVWATKEKEPKCEFLFVFYTISIFVTLVCNSDTNMLYARVINRAAGTPDVVMADFIEDLFAHHREVIKAVNILPIS